MDKKGLLQDKLVELYKVGEGTMTEQQKNRNRERIENLLKQDPVEMVNLGNMENRLALQKEKQERLKNHKSPIDISDIVERLNNEVSILEEIIKLYNDIQK